MQNNTLFWRMQIIGWLVFALLNLAGRGYFIYFHLSELINTLVLTGSLFVSTTLLRWHYRRYLDVSHVLKGLLHIVAASLVSGFVAIAIYAAIIIPNLTYIFKVEAPLVWQQLLLGSPTLLFITLGWSSIYVVFKKQRALKQSQQQQASLKHSLEVAKLDVLLSQVNPHFLFNAINNIRALILEDPHKARAMLADLSEVMRYTMVVDKEALVPLSQELEVVEHYLALNSLQFEDKLKVSLAIDPQTERFPLPTMIVQLLVENAIKHGIGKQRNGGEIAISSQRVDKTWQIKVTNTGQLQPEQSNDHTGIGLTNIRQRLAWQYQDKAALTLQVKGENKVEAIISLPLPPTNTLESA